MSSTLARATTQTSRSCRAAFSTARTLRQQPIYQPPTPPQEPDNPHRAFYKSFGRPIAKVFFMALFTYQVLHYSWMKLEAMEEKEEKTAELEALEGKLRQITGKPAPVAAPEKKV
ncbi:hypothetical protein AUEXF2481DRAFT_44494 [Aureobasidium subglaciale EXF-2481]|uniref:Uncharacterized protein n=1 Tax=Aureobasidium subglaciale (strain EXF-2481) TaxID=1043005 RepID=A0A074XZY3_AURSE|nr:uncharacterized protein AUEXF2481DRAFT_44494 [Aureobasidium subglaciale EXF-2481]KAI5197969.1 hypothetical protein E4T38_07753 [Aureobasidium subglaciale]KAI5216797.1 hypothetical protein E4T40_07763 [Aureobasidium subglaciale]KAI5220041.1 hypothetical protein E4T41_07678 [Aureobasidium subglaciale]KAI5257869.1 hypothetical protein E4T46_07654 [Aureobasidium subglaciale]KEQ91098.1 hypothetical protein AUEXF2481DRAFT_44494 [Aureobasidium subglaciale EXF-2481]